VKGYLQLPPRRENKVELPTKDREKEISNNRGKAVEAEEERGRVPTLKSDQNSLIDRKFACISVLGGIRDLRKGVKEGAQERGAEKKKTQSPPMGD